MRGSASTPSAGREGVPALSFPTVDAAAQETAHLRLQETRACHFVFAQQSGKVAGDDEIKHRHRQPHAEEEADALLADLLGCNLGVDATSPRNKEKFPSLVSELKSIERSIGSTNAQGEVEIGKKRNFLC